MYIVTSQTGRHASEEVHEYQGESIQAALENMRAIIQSGKRARFYVEDREVFFADRNDWGLRVGCYPSNIIPFLEGLLTSQN